MTSENDNTEYKPKEDRTALEIPAKKYSTIVDFQEDLESESEDLDKDEKEKKENENKLKQQVLDHWSKLLVKEPPKRRTCHTSFIHDSYLYVIGGIDITEKKQDDIYKVNIKEPNSSWIKIDTLGEKFGKIAYHAGVEVDGFYYIVGGQDETLTTLNTIQVFDITQERMSETIKLEPEKFPPLESHTVNNYNNQSLIIYGGMSGKDYNKHVYSFDIQTKEVKNLTENLEDDKMPPPRQDHAAVIYNGCLYVYGGIGPDAKIYDDMWKFNLSGNSWEQLKTQNQIDKENRKKQKKMEKEKEQNGEKVEEEEETDDDDDEDIEEDKKDIRPKGRSGHSMVCVGDMFYIFGGKTGLIKESNEIWEFNPNDINYGCVHETLLEQFTKEELNRISAENKDDKHGFRWLTRSEVEKRTNPSFNDNIKEDDKKKKKNKKNDKKNDKNKKKDNDKKNKDNKNDQNKDIEGKYADQVLCRPNVVKMRKTLIFTSDPEKIKEGLKTLSKDEKEKLNPNIVRIKGELPEPRDGQSVCVEGTDLYVFGGDRFKFPFNDLFVLDTVQLPKLPIKERSRKNKEKNKEKDEDKKDNEGIKENPEAEGGEKEKSKVEDNKDENNEDEHLLTLIEKITYPK